MPTNVLLEGALKDNGEYKAEKIKACFKNFNMIIYTSQGVFDTTVYNLCGTHLGQSLNLADVAENAGTTDILVLAYNPIAKPDGQAQKIQNATNITKEYKHIEIPAKTIQKVIIKSRRNFLPNQKPIAKSF